jgi:hypothetical protein
MFIATTPKDSTAFKYDDGVGSSARRTQSQKIFWRWHLDGHKFSSPVPESKLAT